MKTEIENQHQKHPKQKTPFHWITYPSWYWIPLISLLLSILSIGMLFWIYRLSEKQRIDFSLCDVLMDIQIKAATSHLWLEEGITGDPAVDIQEVKSDLDQSISFTDLILNGGKYEHGQVMAPLKDLHLREKVEEIKLLLQESKRIGLQRLEDPKSHGIGSALDQRLDAIFREFQEKAKALEIIAEKNQIQAQGQSKRLFFGLFLTWILIVSAATIAIWNRETRRRDAEKALHHSNEQLQMRTEELRRHQEHLLKLVDERTAELTAANRSLQQEITERKEAEKSLQASTNRFRTLVETLPQSIVLKNEDSVYLYCNENYARNLNIRPNEVFGKTDYDFYPRELAERHMEEDKRVLNSGQAKETKERYLHHGQEVVIQKIILPMKNEEDGTSLLLGITWDITEKIRLESIAEAANLMNNIGYIFAGIGHEIGNPINSAKLTLGILRKKIDTIETLPKETVEDYLERTLGEIAKVEYLLRTLKSFNMYETLELRNVEMRPFMDKFLSLLAVDFVNKGITIESTIKPEAKWGYIDPRALQQVMLNAMNNAADAVEGKEKPRIVLQVLKDDSTIRIKVTDNGCGISEEQQKRLFTPFFTTKSSGTGLGLVIARKLLSRMGGAIDIKSRREEGTTVELSIQEGRDEH